ncbi:MAG: CBS domain-containing protein [Bradyrhizobium sp.]|uniref:CBS domain-containing protein n=1 Tax=Bradyrhizobium sp. TaxID=376 RepID=UPI0025B9F003|nr:CBS domain-containing protein [Bradyrhizobium sp.]MBI5261148.1 CBS domain-containing protein [Bradyrhizobium sp.]
MKARDIMNRNVVATTADASRRAVATLLARHSISAVPVVDEQGRPIGMISEGDLMPRDESAREARRDWWLKALAEGEELNPEFLGFLESQDRSARDMMISPVVTVDEDADAIEIAELLSARKIKRVPVMSGGRMVGIVSRADLVRAFANRQAAQPEPSPENIGKGPALLERHGAMKDIRKPTAAISSAHAGSTELSAGAFRDLALNFKQHETQHRDEVRHQLTETHHKQAEQMMSARLSEASWQHMLRNARAAAQKGDEEQLLLRFPSELCTDHGRAINAPDPSWPTTLRGLAAEVFMRWKKELQPQGFSLVARVVEFPDGLPGDIGLFLEWGRREG